MPNQMSRFYRATGTGTVVSALSPRLISHSAQLAA